MNQNYQRLQDQQYLQQEQLQGNQQLGQVDQNYRSLNQNNQLLQQTYHNVQQQQVSNLNSSNQQNNNSQQGRIHKASHHAHGDDEYNALRIPPNWDEARDHAESRKTGEIMSDLPTHEVKFCKCCGYQIQRKQLEFMKHGTHDLKFLGYCFVIIMVLVCSSGGYNIVTNYMGHFCDHPDRLNVSNEGVQIDVEKEMELCHSNFAHVLSIVNKKNTYIDGEYYDTGSKYLPLQHILNLAASLTVMVVLIFFRRSQRILDRDIDDVQCTPSDFTIIVKNIPKGLDCDYEKELKHIFTHNVVRNEKGAEVQMTVKKVNLVYQIDHIIELEEQLKSVVKKKQEHLKNNYSKFQEAFNQKDPVLKDWDDEIEHIEHRIHKIEHNIPQDQKHYFSGTAFVSFETEQQKDLVLEQNSHSFMEQCRSYLNGGALKGAKITDLMWEKNKLFIEEAPEPDDVDWEFIHIETGRKIKVRIYAWIQTIIFMLLCYLAIFALTKYQGELIEDTFLGLGNGDISIFHIIVDGEYYSTKTKFNIAFAFKLTIALFCNTALLTYFVEILGERNFYGPGGFIYTETWVFIWNTLVPPTVWLIDPWTHQKDGWRKKALKDSKEGKCFLTQDEANKLMEKVEYTQGKRYADIMKTMWFTFFYSPAIPLGLFLSLINLVYYYFIDSYNVFNRRTIKETLSQQVSIEMIENLEMIIIWYSIGNITFSYLLFGDVDLLGWVLLGIGVVYALLPMQEINEWLFPLERIAEVKKFDEAELVFTTNYDRQNPITKKAAIAKFKEAFKAHVEQYNRDQNMRIPQNLSNVVPQNQQQKQQH
ncbi:hypothetical protein PPERSA_08326 [Pseudocohnilembus persalinus]|uniref:CSC1/OSCA1-like cytosolic domain-containing protein n=1 Tax=Pseudocohnilembus persalinus TaxID=266149 RepID=A0A0V0QP47_PSEPJ|nr:hypothetical protein PPERSA_08326 [Pseudocohnilembus persalinus]|eukprot:KRX04111.1 hypothetical protein PPERSA_08326 [Pseudocohnilembus persalinus]